MTPQRELVFPSAVADAHEMFDWDRLRDNLQRALDRQTVILLGGRKMGKTSMLNVVAQWAEGEGTFAVIRLAPVDSARRFMAEILRGVQQWVSAHGSPAPKNAGSAQEGLDSATAAAFVIRKLAARVPGVRFLLCVDEFDSLLYDCGEKEAGRIQNLVVHLATQPTLPVRFLFTVARIPEQIRRSYRSPLPNQSRIVELKPWGKEESRRFVEWQLGEAVVFDDAAHNELFDAAGGHPYFTKAVLYALLDSARPEGRTVSAQMVRSAARAAAASHEVDFTLANMVKAYLLEAAAPVLDRAAASPGGLTQRDIRELAPDHDLLKTLLDGGLLALRNQRYVLRLGLWRLWRQAHPGSLRPRFLTRLVRRIGPVIRSRRTRHALYSILAVLIVTLAAGAAILLPTDTFTATSCAGPAAGVSAQVSYPSYVSGGDENTLHVQVLNKGGTDSVDGSAVVSFPDGQASIIGDNEAEYSRLIPKAQTGTSVSFTAAANLFATRKILAELTISVAGVTCPPQRWTMTVAPIPHLKLLQGIGYGLLGAVLIPLMIEMVVRRRHRPDTPGDGPQVPRPRTPSDGGQRS